MNSGRAHHAPRLHLFAILYLLSSIPSPPAVARFVSVGTIYPAACRRMGDAALQKGAATNTWQDYAERLLAEYERRLEIKALPRTTPARRPEPALTLRA